jgi:chemotaxis methyl-accepting protein methylase
VEQLCVSGRYRHLVFFDARGDVALGSRKLVSRSQPTAVQRPSKPLDSEEAELFQRLLSLAGLDWQDYRTGPLERRLPACLRALRVRTIREARRKIASDPDARAAAIGALLIGVTSFFRDSEVFDALDRDVLTHWSPGERGPRVWSAGCADGAELYSVAMLLARRSLLDDAWLEGSDCRADAILAANRGMVHDLALQTLDADFAEQFVRRERLGYRISPALRAATHWRVGNVLNRPPAGQVPWDIILCRNLAIYLEPAAAIQLWTNLADQLRPGGFLVVGKAERPREARGLHRVSHCIYRKAC